MLRRLLLLCAGMGFMMGVTALAVAQDAGLPPAESAAKARLDSSPRHGEWVTVDAGGGDKVDAFVVYPQRPDKAPVVIVIHEIFGLSDWVRATADQLAAEGFIAIAPDLISGKAPGGKGSRAVSPDDARTLIAALDPAEISRRLDAVAKYGTSLPAALPKFATIGFCWGGGVSFAYAAAQPGLSAAVVYYGTPPAKDALGRIKAPVLGMYGGSDARVDATLPPADQEMKRLGKSFDYTLFDGAGHAFARVQDGMSGANMKAIQQAWPRTIRFLKTNLESGVSLRPGELAPAVAVRLDPECTCVDDGDDGSRTALLPAAPLDASGMRSQADWQIAQY